MALHITFVLYMGYGLYMPFEAFLRPDGTVSIQKVLMDRPTIEEVAHGIAEGSAAIYGANYKKEVPKPVHLSVDQYEMFVEPWRLGYERSTYDEDSFCSIH
jgi:hypothetical protein